VQGEAKLAKNLPESLCKFGFCNTVEIVSDVSDHADLSRNFDYSNQLRFDVFKSPTRGGRRKYDEDLDMLGYYDSIETAIK
jgi:hypothetical protein